ncbi:MAG: sortase [Candidatus Levybacteria bacterium]|nr:sortase [Candidatus Levybacteria bacterium]
MVKKVYKKRRTTIDKKRFLKLVSLFVIGMGILIAGYVFFPLISWQLYFAPVFANAEINSPIPKSTIVNQNSIASLLQGASQTLSGVDYTNAQNWFPSYRYDKQTSTKTSFYKISIPKINIKDAQVSAVDTDLLKHLVNYGGTAVPPDNGNAAIFGHSTLPQLYKEGNYKTIFTFLYKLTIGDEIIVTVGNVTYKYRVENISVVDPDNTSVLEQSFDDSFITLITCTPPGTIWKRLAIKARLIKT